MIPSRIYDATEKSIFDFFIVHSQCSELEATKMTNEELKNIKIHYFVNNDSWGLVDIQKGSQIIANGKVFENLDKAKIFQLKNLIHEYVMDTRLGEDIGYGEYISMKQELDKLGEIYPEELI